MYGLYEIYWHFKEIPQGLSYSVILQLPNEWRKFGKLYIYYSLAIYLQFYFKITWRWPKYGPFLLNCMIRRTLQWFFWKFRLWVDFKIESVLFYHYISRPKRKIEFIVYLWRNGSICSWLSITQNLMRDKAITTIKHKNCLKKWVFKPSNMNFKSFALKGSARI